MQYRDSNSKLGRFANELRKHSTGAERWLWVYLRARQIDGWHFRRQHPICGYIIDFYCDALKLGIELDGRQHLTEDGKAADGRRTDVLARAGIEILRVGNVPVMEDAAAVAQNVLWACRRRAGELNVAAPQRRRRFGKRRVAEDKGDLEV